MEPQRYAISTEEFLLLNELISNQFGISFPEHKKDLLAARLCGRLHALRLPRFLDYYLELQQDRGGERLRAGELLTNNETYFFREVGGFEALLQEIRESRPVRRWRVLCAGCSSGEEPYTLRMLASRDALAMGGSTIDVDAFDLDAARIEAARRAVYGRSSLRTLTPEQEARYLNRVTEGAWSLKEAYRDGIRFAWGNILDLATFRPAERYDAIFCRNVFIYFSEAGLRCAVRNFAEVLRPGGLLFLGTAESIIGLDECFETVRLPGSIAYRKVAP